MNFYRNSFNTTQWETMLCIFAQRQWGNEDLLITSGSWNKTLSQIQLPFLLLICLNIGCVEILHWRVCPLVNYRMTDTKCIEWTREATPIYVGCSARVWGERSLFLFSPYSRLGNSCPSIFLYPFLAFSWELRPIWLVRFIRTFHSQTVLLRGTVIINLKYFSCVLFSWIHLKSVFLCSRDRNFTLFPPN